jgi:hypothetical protein
LVITTFISNYISVAQRWPFKIRQSKFREKKEFQKIYKMAQNPELEPAHEQFGPQLSQEQWTPENYDNSPHLVYKTGI